MSSHAKVERIRFEREFLPPGSAPRANHSEFRARGVAQRLPVRSALVVIVVLSAVLWFAIWTLLTNLF